MTDLELIKEARKRIPKVMAALEALETSRLVFLEAMAVRAAVRGREDMLKGAMPKVLPTHASKAGRVLEAIIRERRGRERRAAERAAAANGTGTPIAA
jgi:hypothetical protein